ncbi:NOG1 family protein [Candidatus Pyrohabitans sp.]
MNFKRVPQILNSEELMDYAFSKASKEAKRVSVSGSRLGKIKKREVRRIKVAGSSIRRYLNRILLRIPQIDELSPFYYELIETLVGIEKFKKSLSSIRWIVDKIGRLEREYTRKVRTAGDEAEIHGYRKEFYGRVASLLRKIDPELIFLREVREKLKNLPTVENTFTVVIAGAPNVGKSSLLRRLTGAEPRVESYPFTTKQLLLGYMEYRHRRVQVIDTPGLLDRSFEDMKRVERQCILALKHLARLIIFVFDPSETCGYPLEEQLRIYRSITESFDVEVVPVINKADLLTEKALQEAKKIEPMDRALICSAKEGTGIDEIVARITGTVNDK